MRRLRVGEDVPLTLGWSRVAVRAHYGALPLARLDEVRVKAGKPAGSISCGRWAQYPEERSFDLNNVAVARRKALRGSGLPAIRQAGAASVTTKCALRRAASPHVARGEMLIARTRKRRENAISCLQK